MRGHPEMVDRPHALEVPVTEPTPTTEDGEVIGPPPAPPETTDPIDPTPPPVVITEPPVVNPGGEPDPSDL